MQGERHAAIEDRTSLLRGEALDSDPDALRVERLSILANGDSEKIVGIHRLIQGANVTDTIEQLADQRGTSTRQAGEQYGRIRDTSFHQSLHTTCSLAPL